ncbi:SCO5918 family protein [Actinacidiphila oryziradicis]|jgi:hypothetical protein|uniref:Uncharacterized protein n=1 Tax=Actinacidiphila oryziradicis TaxID=2571141 RepID=A0A4U0RZZ1_9ACTN|nr:SCO5918 family protein [Actinacidiphila oryziradicis]MCW2875169.1 hypothetical protein [Actinacidiphila oryziradicis]TKA00371.1 hypothetical protein FCI23_42845 [Actinacidiphila oryziradicis]
MRCVIARFSFDLVKSEVQESMKGIKPEPVTGASVIIGRRAYPIKQVGEVITKQDRRDFSSSEVIRALTRLGFTCRTLPEPAPAAVLTPIETASALLGSPAQM